MNRVCKKGEQTLEYGQNLCQLYCQAYPGSAVNERVLVDLFCERAPHPDMQRHVQIARPANLDSAIMIALRR